MLVLWWESAGAAPGAEPSKADEASALKAPMPSTSLPASSLEAEVSAKIIAAYQQKRGHYKIRTHLLQEQGSPKYINRLIFESSPYLIQHAHTPVNWYPWGDVAFAEAKRQNKPIFLSVGYSTCHWCHVMERESFDNEEVAAYLNKHFISVKVDREELPDVDEIYLTATQMITGQSGWPNTVFVTSEGKPFFAGTYFAKPAFQKLLAKVNSLWQSKQPRLLALADELTAKLNEHVQIDSASDAEPFGQVEVSQAIAALLKRHDSLYGGFVSDEKFPSETSLRLLMQEIIRSGSPSAFKALEKSLREMAMAGLQDHVGGGFHRYSVDAQWRVPHFEKMLYNQAQLLELYSQFFALTKDPFYKVVATRIARHVLRDMRDAQGLFYSAIDAESEGIEGLFYFWSKTELTKQLDRKQMKTFDSVYHLVPVGESGDKIIHMRPSVQLSTGVNSQAFQKLNDKLFEIRKRRASPFKDSKRILAWNAMTISALASAGVLLADETLSSAAKQAGTALWSAVDNRQNASDLLRLPRIVGGGETGAEHVPASLRDYMFLLESLIRLYDTTGQGLWLDRAMWVYAASVDLFWDKESGGFFDAHHNLNAPAIARTKSIYDQAIPAGNGLALSNLQGLFERSGELALKRKIQRMLKVFTSTLQEQADSAASYVTAASRTLSNVDVMGPRYFAGGKGRLRVKSSLLPNETSSGQYQVELTIDVDIDTGWHVNSHMPTQEYLRPTRLKPEVYTHSIKINETRYPAKKNWSLKGSPDVLSVFDNQFAIVAHLELSAPTLRVIPLALELQACDDQRCLAPERISLRVVF